MRIAKGPKMNVLIVHYVVGILVAASAALFSWWNPGRRAVLYLLTLQILLGAVAIATGLRAPAAHYGLALVAWAGYMAANGMARRPERRRAALAVAALSTLLVLIAFSFGYSAVHG